MKTLYYNPFEFPLKVRIKSNIFEFEEPYTSGFYFSMDELFKLASCDNINEVEVYLTSHNEAYVKRSKTSPIGVTVTGWISLKSVKNGGGYLPDKYFVKLEKESK